MIRFAACSALALGLSMGVALAQSQQPYAGLQERPIKALSDQQIADLKAGRGMGLALPAELNGYPGPRHVLDLAEGLGLTAEQQARARQFFDEMAAQAIVLGERVIAGEAALDRLFAKQAASDESVQLAAIELGRLQGELRGHHLRYHLAMRDLLSPHQVMRYQQLRGYQGHEGSRGHGHGEVR